MAPISVFVNVVISIFLFSMVGVPCHKSNKTVFSSFLEGYG
jgi:hypothetical protein